jgi:GTP-binding protein
LGVLTLGAGGDDSRDIIIADIPGLIEGASEGHGLGIRFLKHISRTSALAFLIDLGEDNYLEAFDILKLELEAFSPELVAKPRVIIGTKLDLELSHAKPEGENSPQASIQDRLMELKSKYPNEQVLGISVFSGAGIQELASLFGSLVNQEVSA